MSKHKHTSTRKAPAHKAKKFKLKTKKRGIDGKFWIVSKRVDGIKYWKRFKKAKKKRIKRYRSNKLIGGEARENVMNILFLKNFVNGRVVDNQNEKTITFYYDTDNIVNGNTLKKFLSDKYRVGTDYITIVIGGRKVGDYDLIENFGTQNINVIIKNFPGSLDIYPASMEASLGSAST